MPIRMDKRHVRHAARPERQRTASRLTRPRALTDLGEQQVAFVRIRLRKLEKLFGGLPTGCRCFLN